MRRRKQEVLSLFKSHLFLGTPCKQNADAEHLSVSFHDPNKGNGMERRVRVPGALAAVRIRYVRLCLTLVFSHLKRSSRREGFVHFGRWCISRTYLAGWKSACHKHLWNKMILEQILVFVSFESKFRETLGTCCTSLLGLL